MIYKITTKLVSGNRRIVPRGRGIAPNSKYKLCKESLSLELYKPENKPIKHFTINISLGSQENKIDLDNAVKPIMDALESANIIENDRYCKKMTISRIKQKHTYFILEEVKE